MKKEFKVGDLAYVQWDFPWQGIEIGDLVLLISKESHLANFSSHEFIHQKTGQKNTVLSCYLKKAS